MTGGTIPSATYNNGTTITTSTVYITSPVSGTVNGFGQTFSNVTVNTSSGVTTTINANPTISGTLTLTSGTFAIAGQTMYLYGHAIAGSRCKYKPVNYNFISTGIGL